VYYSRDDSMQGITRKKGTLREIMLFIGKPKGRSKMMSNARFNTRYHTQEGNTVIIRDDVKLAQLVRALDQPDFVVSILAKPQKPKNSNLHGFELHRPSSKGIHSCMKYYKQTSINGLRSQTLPDSFSVFVLQCSAYTGI